MADKTDKPYMTVGEVDSPPEATIINSFVASDAIMKGSPVELTNDGKVTATPSTFNAIGVAVKSVATGEQCPVLQQGRVKVVADGALSAAGCAVRMAGNGKVTELYDQTVNEGGSAQYTVYANRKLGTALNKADANGDLIFIQVEKW